MANIPKLFNVRRIFCSYFILFSHIFDFLSDSQHIKDDPRDVPRSWLNGNLDSTEMSGVALKSSLTSWSCSLCRCEVLIYPFPSLLLHLTSEIFYIGDVVAEWISNTIWRRDKKNDRHKSMWSCISWNMGFGTKATVEHLLHWKLICLLLEQMSYRGRDPWLSCFLGFF